jgi:hypothetical protein
MTATTAHRPLFDRLDCDAATVGLAARTTTAPQTTAPGFLDLPDGGHIAGLVYQTDYDATQEWGLSDLRKRLCGTGTRNLFQQPGTASHVVVFSDVNAFALSCWPLTDTGAPLEACWGDHVARGGSPDGPPGHATFFTQNLPWVQHWAQQATTWDTMAELRRKAKELGLDGPLPRTKAALLDRIQRSPVTRDSAEHPNRWPAWFDGQLLVVRADDGLTAGIVAGLRDAAVAEQLVFGSASGPFRTGLFLYDRRDETEALITARAAQWDWYEARMSELAPVRAELEAKGHRFYFLGNPRQGGWNTADGQEDDAVRYWLNGTGRPQPGGWFTLDELRAEAFIRTA